MFSKLPQVSNLIPQSARDAMSLEVADRSFFYDKLSRGGASSLESLGQHYSATSYDAATLRNEPTNGEFSPQDPPSPGAPAGDHRRHVSRTDRAKPNRTATHATKSNPTTADTNTGHPKHHSAPSSAENTQRKPGCATQARTGSGKPDDRNGPNRHGSAHGKNHRPNTKATPSPVNKIRPSGRKAAKGTIKPNEMNLDGGVTGPSKDSQRQMKQKAKLAIAMWKERMTKKRESSASRVLACHGCFPPLNPTDDTSPEGRTRGPDSPRCRKMPEKTADTSVDVVTVSPILSPETAMDVDEDGRAEVMESPIPRSSPDDLSATDGSTKAASSSTQQLDNKRNSASSRENQRSKIPRPVDGQEKVKKNDSAETTSILSSSEKEATSRENLLPEELLLPLSPRVTTSQLQSVLSDNVRDEARESSETRDFLPPRQPQQPLLHAQQHRPVAEPLRDKRRRREDRRLLHSTDDEEDDWPISPSAVGSQPIIASRSKPRARHHPPRRSPKPVASASPLSLQSGKRCSGGDADTGEGEGGSPGAGLDSLSMAVIMPHRKPYLHRKMVEIKLGGLTNDMIRKRQRQEIYALNQVMTALEFAQFEHFCRTRNVILSA